MATHRRVIAGVSIMIKVKALDSEGEEHDPGTVPHAIVEGIAAALERGERSGGILVHELSLLFSWSAEGDRAGSSVPRRVGSNGSAAN
jgi:hypothetical protein